jgi:hypothetical protein
MDIRFLASSVCLNGGANKEVDAVLEPLFESEYNTSYLEVSSDCGQGDTLESATMFFSLTYKDKAHNDEELLIICIDDWENIDALRRYCEMVLEHRDKMLLSMLNKEKS